MMLVMLMMVFRVKSLTCPSKPATHDYQVRVIILNCCRRLSLLLCGRGIVVALLNYLFFFFSNRQDVLLFLSCAYLVHAATVVVSSVLCLSILLSLSLNRSELLHFFILQ